MIKTPVSREWTAQRRRIQAIDKFANQASGFINEAKIFHCLEQQRSPDPGRIRAILQKSLAVETLALEETAALISVTDPDLLEEMSRTAAAVKRKVYDNRIVVFAPLYLGNRCVNRCVYCGFKSSNRTMPRRILDVPALEEEVRVLAGDIGHKRLIAVYGEHPGSDSDYIISSLATIYGVRADGHRGPAGIRRVNVNAAPMTVSELSAIKQAGLGTYQVFQETYHRNAYRRFHPPGTLKADFNWRLTSMHRAMEAGIDDVGIGALFGLYDWRFEVLGLLSHAHELEKTFGIGPHTVSFPRLEPALGCGTDADSPFRVSDENFRRLIVVLRLAIPYTGLIITARESPALRRELLPVACTQTDASSKIAVGGYAAHGQSAQEVEKQQFLLGDTRSLDTVIRELAEMGLITSFCTAGYRCGRTGMKIMNLLRSGTEGRFCKANAVLTFREWLDDFASSQTREAGERVIADEIRQVRERLPELYGPMAELLNKIEKGERDLYL